MKKYKIIYILILFIICSCGNRNEGYFKHDVINTTFYITETYKAKYSKVKGYIIYNNIKIPIDNGNKGYHYKDYNLNIGDKIETSIDIYYYSSNYGYELVFGDINLSNYEQSSIH